MPRKIIAVLLSVLVIVATFALPTFAAEEEAASTSVDWSQYPTANLIAFPYTSRDFSAGGLTWTVQEDYGIAVEGEITGYSAFTLCTLPVSADRIYTFNLGHVVRLIGINIEVRFLDTNGLTVGTVYAGLDASALTFSTADYTGASTMRISLLRQSAGLPTQVVDTVIYPQLNAGTVAYPYSPYMPYLLEQQYNNGYTNGEAAGDQEGYDRGFLEGTNAGIIQGTTEGYQQGYQAAVDMIGAETMNPFFSASLTVTVEGDILPSEWSFDYEVPIVLSADGALSVNSCVSYVKSQMAAWHPDIDLSNANYTFKFTWVDQSATEGAFDCEGSLFAYRGAVGVATASMLLASYDGYLNGERKVYTSDVVSSGEGTFLFDKGQTVGFTLSDLKVYYQDYAANRTADLYLYATENVESPQYNVGYAQGFSDGQKSSLGDAGKVYYDQGYNEGFKNGRIDGLKVAETGDWNHLMTSVIEAPVNALQSLFDFEVLGLDMRVAVGTILTFCVVMIVFKKVVF